MRKFLFILFLLAMAVPSFAQVPAQSEIQVDQNLGESIPLNLSFTNQNGEEVLLSEYFDGEKPVILMPAYYSCPMLCGLVINGMAESLADLGWKAGEDYRIVTFSFDPKDTPVSAKERRSKALDEAGMDLKSDVWPFLTGELPSIRPLTDAIGFHFIPDPTTGQYAHAAIVLVLTPKGRVARYLYGISFPVRDLKLALMEASEGEIGNIVDQVILRCYQYDPTKRKYGLYISGIFQVGGVILFIVVGSILLVLWRLEWRRKQRHE